MTETAAAIRRLASARTFTLRLGEDDARAIGSVDGLVVDTAINTFTSDGRWSIARLGPTEWQVICDEAAAELPQSLRDALAGRHHACVDVGAGRAAFTVSGPRAIASLAGGCPLDLDPPRFPPGRATRTLFGKAEVIVWSLDALPRFRIDCGRSFADYVHALLNQCYRDAA